MRANRWKRWKEVRVWKGERMGGLMDGCIGGYTTGRKGSRKISV